MRVGRRGWGLSGPLALAARGGGDLRLELPPELEGLATTSAGGAGVVGPRERMEPALELDEGGAVLGYRQGALEAAQVTPPAEPRSLRPARPCEAQLELCTGLSQVSGRITLWGGALCLSEARGCSVEDELRRAGRDSQTCELRLRVGPPEPPLEDVVRVQLAPPIEREANELHWGDLGAGWLVDAVRVRGGALRGRVRLPPSPALPDPWGPEPDPRAGQLVLLSKD